MAEEIKKSDDVESRRCKHCGKPIVPKSYGWVHIKGLTIMCDIHAEPDDGKTDFATLKRVSWEQMIDNRCYLFKNGGYWAIAQFKEETETLGADDMDYNQEYIDNGILYELPEE